jgi:hypothetical protein
VLHAAVVTRCSVGALVRCASRWREEVAIGIMRGVCHVLPRAAIRILLHVACRALHWAASCCMLRTITDSDILVFLSVFILRSSADRAMSCAIPVPCAMAVPSAMAA